jgi:ADP-ribosylglycohydrolase
MSEDRRSLEFVTGCLAGGAVGDALGAAVEFDGLDAIRRRFGDEGVSDYAPAYGRKGAITDDTQMTLFTAEGLILAAVRGDGPDAEPPVIPVYRAYLRWLATQRGNPAQRDALLKTHGSCAMVDGLLMTRPELYSQRAPGNTCLSALASGKMGTMDDPINDSKGCGGVMRAAPVAYGVPENQVFDVGCQIAAVTHGHPSGYLAAGALAWMVFDISRGRSLRHAVEAGLEMVSRRPHSRECRDAIRAALNAADRLPPTPETVETLGAGWIAEEALAISVFCALIHENDFEAALRLAVSHSGDSDSTGAITGNLLGSLHGENAIPPRFLAELELLDLIREVAADLHERMPPVDPVS